jgi:hypothetical protein
LLNAGNILTPSIFLFKMSILDQFWAADRKAKWFVQRSRNKTEPMDAAENLECALALADFLMLCEHPDVVKRRMEVASELLNLNSLGNAPGGFLAKTDGSSATAAATGGGGLRSALRAP